MGAKRAIGAGLAVAVGLWLAGCGGSSSPGGPAGAGAATKHGMISGKVLDKDGKPLHGAAISFNGKSPGTTGAQVFAHPDGSFSWGGPQGTYEVVVTVGGKEVLRQTVELNQDRMEGVQLKAQ